MEIKQWPFWLCWLLTAFLAGCAEGQENSGPISQGDYAAFREKMVAAQIKARGVRDPRVLKAMRKVERHRFVPPELQKTAYQDHPLPIGEGQTISQPYIVAFMTELLEVGGEDRVLEIGTGSGYQAAVLAELVKEVYTIEIVPSLASSAKQRLRELGHRNIQVKAGDGYLGWPEAAPFDAIMITAAPYHIPQPLLDQLKEGGRMVVPVGVGTQMLKKIVKKGGKIVSQDVAPVLFVPMTGEEIKKGR